MNVDRKEDGVILKSLFFTRYTITVNPVHFCPGPYTFFTQFIQLCSSWHSPAAAPLDMSHIIFLVQYRFIVFIAILGIITLLAIHTELIGGKTIVCFGFSFTPGVQITSILGPIGPTLQVAHFTLKPRSTNSCCALAGTPIDISMHVNAKQRTFFLIMLFFMFVI